MQERREIHLRGKFLVEITSWNRIKVHLHHLHLCRWFKHFRLNHKWFIYERVSHQHVYGLACDEVYTTPGTVPLEPITKVSCTQGWMLKRFIYFFVSSSVLNNKTQLFLCYCENTVNPKHEIFMYLFGANLECRRYNRSCSFYSNPRAPRIT